MVLLKRLGGIDRHNCQAVLNLGRLFKKQTIKFVDQMTGHSIHNLGINLPNSSDPELASWLLKFAKTCEAAEWQLVASRWENLKPEQKVLAKKSVKKALEVARAACYKDVKSEEFAKEAAKWGLDSSKYSKTETIYLCSLEVPTPFSVKEEFKADGLVGHFLPRSDVRVGFFGQYTNCCQHWNGVGKSCAISSVKDAFSQLFVIEDNKGDIVCGSWVWVNDSAQVCFDNVEAKGLGTREEACREIYLMASEWICNSGYPAVGTGTGHADLSFPDHSVEVKWSLPSHYSGYSDADTVKVLAQNSNPTKTGVSLGQVYVRGLLESDLNQATQVAIACYPVGHQHVSADADSTGLVLVKENIVVGYAIYNEEDKYVADIAVLPSHRRHSTKLVDKLLSNLEILGGVWTADCRESTSLKLLNAYARRGRLQMEVGAVSHALSNVDGDQCYQVQFWF